MEEERRDFYLYFIYRRYDASGDEEVCYVGRGCGKRVETHIRELKKGKHDNWQLQEWFLKDDSAFLPCVMHKGLTNYEANDLEISYITRYGRFDLGKGTLANLTDGGEGAPGKITRLETRKKMSEAAKGRPKSDEHRANIRKGMTGLKYPEERRRNIGKACRGRIISQETRAKQSAAIKGTKKPEGFRDTMRLVKLGEEGIRLENEIMQLKNTGMKSVEVARQLNVPTYKVYNTVHKNKAA